MNTINPPPRRRKRTVPVSSFGPQLMAVWLKGTREEVKIPFPNKKTAQQFQLRLQMLRGAMQREDHPQKDLVQRAKTSLRTGDRIGPEHANDPEGKRYALLVVYPADSQFNDVLRKAGIEVSGHEAGLLGNPEAAPQMQLPSPEGGSAPEPELPLDNPVVDPLQKYR